jgi:hypothetical protein
MLSPEEARSKLLAVSDDARTVLEAMIHAVQHFDNGAIAQYDTGDVFDHVCDEMGWTAERCGRALVELQDAGLLYCQQRGPKS